ncbi:hypothetical protein [Ancylobacter sp.]|uniref:hypothetical protein n=1 Tax=Ancylobacter sp. TaxID=1872567 RepID=UPI003BAA1DDC
MVFVAHVENFPGGIIEIDHVTRHIAKKDGYIAFIQEIISDTDATLKCVDSIDKDGYFTSNLDHLVYIEIDGCDIKYLWEYNLIDPFMIIFGFLIEIYLYIFT